MNHNRTMYRPFSILDELFQQIPGTQAHQYSPAVNVTETNDAWHVDLMVPGYSKEAFTIEADKGILTVKAAKVEQAQEDGKKVRRKEFTLNGFSRSFTLDEKMDTEAITAHYHNGILTLALPKKEEVKAQPKLISIQ